MRARSVVWVVVAAVVTFAAWPMQRATGQEVALAARSPRFLYAGSQGAKPVEVDATRAAVLRRVVSLDVEQPTVGRLLATIERQTGITFAYGNDFNAERPVTLHADAITVASALAAILYDAGVDVVLSPGDHVALVKHAEPLVPPVGRICGKVTDAKTGSAIGGATVVVEGASRSATSGNDGRYRIADVTAGTYTVRARYIGYAPASASVTVQADQEATADFTLEKSAQRLDEVVTTGTVVPTEVRALPTPVTVISDSDIAVRHARTVLELFREAVPGAVSFDRPEDYYLTPFATRGASTLAGAGQMKVFIDGIPVAEGGASGIDPAGVDRIEVIRGPQASAIYGSDAIGGVLQVFTKHGDPTLKRPQLNAEAAVGTVQTPYDGYGGVLRQNYTASVQGGSTDASYNLGGGYTRIADYVSAGSAQSSPSVYGGFHFQRSMASIDASGRYYTEYNPVVCNPAIAATGLSSCSKPYYQPFQFQHQTLGARFSITPSRWWEHSLTLGVDRLSSDMAQTQPRLLTPTDTLLQLYDQTAIKTSIGYTTTLHGTLGSALAGSITAGVDHYSYPTNGFFSGGAVNSTGVVVLGPDGYLIGFRTGTNNTGYFAQGQVGFQDALFLTAGLRAEHNTNFGDSLGTPVSPRVGIAFAQPLGSVTLKVRGSWGRAIRAPAPGNKSAFVQGTSTTLANPILGPERQHGWDVGLDATIGTRGVLSVTAYDQTADNLIDLVTLQTAPISIYQYQNVGRVKNTGVEVEGSLALGSLALKGQYAYTRSHVERLSPTYTGDLRIGDQVLAVPRHTAAASATFSLPQGTSLTGGLSYVGSWTNYDDLAQYRCFAGTGSCRATSRDYITVYPHFVKLNATLSQRVTSAWSGFIAVDNLTNNQSTEWSNTYIVMGRISMIGLRLHY